MSFRIAVVGVLLAITGCASVSEEQRHNRQVFEEAINDPENVALSRMGCTYEQVQKALNGVPQEAPYSELQKAWGTKSMGELKVMHGLKPSAEFWELYRAVRIELKNARVCEKKLEA